MEENNDTFFLPDVELPEAQVPSTDTDTEFIEIPETEIPETETLSVEVEAPSAGTIDAVDGSEA